MNVTKVFRHIKLVVPLCALLLIAAGCPSGDGDTSSTETTVDDEQSTTTEPSSTTSEPGGGEVSETTTTGTDDDTSDGTDDMDNSTEDMDNNMPDDTGETNGNMTDKGVTDGMFSEEEQAAIDAWSLVFNPSSEFTDVIPHLEDAENLEATYAQYQETARAFPATSMDVTEISISDNTATFTFDAMLESTPIQQDLQGSLTSTDDGTWIVTRDVFCGFIQRIGVQCPEAGDTEGSDTDTEDTDTEDNS